MWARAAIPPNSASLPRVRVVDPGAQEMAEQDWRIISHLKLRVNYWLAL